MASAAQTRGAPLMAALGARRHGGASRRARRATARAAKTPHAAVVGAGPAGLAAALALRRAGLSVTVYERASRLDRNAGAGVAIWPNGTRALALLDARASAQLERDGCELTGVLAPGMETVPFPVRAMHGGAPAVMMQWSALQRLLLERCSCGSDGGDVRSRPVSVTLGAELANIEALPDGSVALLGASGDSLGTADIVVGADGIRSGVRKATGCPAEVLDGGRRLVRSVVPRAKLSGAAAKFPRGATAMWRGKESGATLGLMDVGQDCFYWAAGLLDGSDVSAATDDVRTLAEGVASEAEASGEGLGPIMGEIVRDAVSVTQHVYDNRSLSIPPQFDSPWEASAGGAITLCGDAMHAVVPSFGHGACLALEDAVVLGRHMAVAVRNGGTAEDLRAALRAYESARLQRTAQAQIFSWKDGENAYGRAGDEFDSMARDFSEYGPGLDGVRNWMVLWDGQGDGELSNAAFGDE